MLDPGSLEINDKWIRSLRGVKNKLDPSRAFAWSVEKERTRKGPVEDTATVFLTNRECPFTCLMCDLWKNTTDKPVTADQLSLQLASVMPKIKKAKHLKLYNSGNFFDTKAIPENAYSPIAEHLHSFKTLTVESHPKLINERCLKFRDSIEPELQVAMGLETANPTVLSRLNKQMTLKDFSLAVRLLNRHRIEVRAFILLKPPFLKEKEGIIWAKRSIDFAFQCGVECCVIIPTRGGNGAMEWMEEKGYYEPPRIESLEEVLEYGIKQKSGRVFADLWDLEKFSRCNDCFAERKKRLNKINLYQEIQDPVTCKCRQ